MRLNVADSNPGGNLKLRRFQIFHLIMSKLVHVIKRDCNDILYGT